MKITTVAIAALIATNLAAGAYIAWHSRPAEIYVDHLEDLRVAKSDGNLHAQLGDSRSGASATLVFTPHGAIQFHNELERMFALVQKEADRISKGRPAAPESPDRAL